MPLMERKGKLNFPGEKYYLIFLNINFKYPLVKIVNYIVKVILQIDSK